MGHARDSLDFEDGLGLGAERDSCLKRILDAMTAEELEQIGRILVDDDIGLGDVYAEAVREILFFLLET